MPTCVVLGAGGAASAIVDALVRYDAASIVGPRTKRGEGRGPHPALHQRPRQLPGLPPRRPNCQHRSGRPGEVVEAAVLQGVHHDTIAVDITYDPRQTEWRERYSDAGCRTMNGLAMLAFQAALQMQWWWGVDDRGRRPAGGRFRDRHADLADDQAAGQGPVRTTASSWG